MSSILKKKKIKDAREKARDQALASMNDELREAYDEIYKEIAEQANRTVLWYHSLGLKILKVHKSHTTYGEGAVEKLARAITIDPTLVYKAKELAEQFTKGDLQDYLVRGAKIGHLVTMGHFTPVLSIDHQQQRELLDRVVEEGLTVARLKELIDALKSGRKLSNIRQVPKTIDGGLRQVVSMGGRMIEKFDSTWESALFGPLLEIDDKAVDEDLIKRVSKTQKIVNDLADRADKRAHELSEVVIELQRVLHARSASSPPDEEEEKEEEQPKPAGVKKERRPVLE